MMLLGFRGSIIIVILPVWSSALPAAGITGLAFVYGLWAVSAKH
jgi:hypothetical protein